MKFNHELFGEALRFANEMHNEQFRKGTSIQYISHLMHVSAYIMEFGGDTDQAIAGLLHDVIEDQHGKTSYEDLERRFGKKVSDLVRSCTDSETSSENKAPWEDRKRAYVERLKAKDPYTKLVVACDKFHNLQSIVRDVNAFGLTYLERFSAKPDRLLWYYEELLKGLQNLDSPIVKLYEAEVKEFRKQVQGR